jgi:hypothetical protein
MKTRKTKINEATWLEQSKQTYGYHCLAIVWMKHQLQMKNENTNSRDRIAEIFVRK